MQRNVHLMPATVPFLQRIQQFSAGMQMAKKDTLRECFNNMDLNQLHAIQAINSKADDVRVDTISDQVWRLELATIDIMDRQVGDMKLALTAVTNMAVVMSYNDDTGGQSWQQLVSDVNGACENYAKNEGRREERRAQEAQRANGIGAPEVD